LAFLDVDFHLASFFVAVYSFIRTKRVANTTTAAQVLVDIYHGETFFAHFGASLLNLDGGIRCEGNFGAYESLKRAFG